MKKLIARSIVVAVPLGFVLWIFGTLFRIAYLQLGWRGIEEMLATIIGILIFTFALAWALRNFD